MNYEVNHLEQLDSQRKAVVQLGLVTVEEAENLDSGYIVDLINESGNVILKDGDSYAIVPKEFEDVIIWIR